MSDVAQIRAIEDWRERSRLAVCRIEELWDDEMSQERSYYERQADLLRRFDLVICGCLGSVAPVTRLTNARCIYAPPGVDATAFCPVPPGPSRTIDVMSIGRRSERTNRALVELARKGNIFTEFDTIRGTLSSY